ncbi:MAG: hypothetical protein GY816_10860 [Cytophagales bacterium]|nr:hypothetical protein [Cytophagales bacterium]
MKLSFYTCIYMMSIVVFGQTLPETQVVDTRVNPGQFLIEILLPPPITEGSTYHNDKWLLGRINLKGGHFIDNTTFRYDIQNDLIEVKTKESIKVCDSWASESFVWFDPEKLDSVKFVNIRNYSVDGSGPLSGFFEILIKDSLSLFSRFELEIKEPTYFPTIDMGSHKKKIIKKEIFYLIEDMNAKILYPQLRKNLIYFGQHASDVKAYAKRERLQCRKRDEIIKIVNYYNSLNSSLR